MENQPVKNKILENNQLYFDEIQYLLGEMGEEQITKPGTAGEWSLREVLVHLIFWQEKLMEWLDAEDPEVPAPGMTWKTPNVFDILNAQAVEASKDLPLADVLKNFEDTHTRMKARIEALSEEDLTETGRFAWLFDHALKSIVAGCTYAHYREHLKQFEKVAGIR